MPRRDEVLASMRDALQLQDPEWDITPGTGEYRILEALAQQVENITYNSVLNDYHFDVDKKSGLELDFFMSLFGFSRIKARRAIGEVTFSRGTPAAQDYAISIGTQVFVPATDFQPSLFFQTTVSTVLPVGATEVSVPVQAVIAGTTGNVAAGSITGIATSVGGVTAVFNAQPITGGRDAESDQDLRDRWRRSVFRNISGTEDQFLALAFNEPGFVTRANVIGPVERYREQIELIEPYDLTTASPWTSTLNESIDSGETAFDIDPGTGDRFPVADSANESSWFYAGVYDGADSIKEVVRVTSRAAGVDTLTVERSASVTHVSGNVVRMVFLSSVTDSAYTFPPGGEVVGLDISLTTQRIGRRGTDYEYYNGTTVVGSIPSGTATPILYVTPVGSQSFGLNVVIEMEHEYTPVASRNAIASGVADKVDMFVDGEDSYTVTEQFPMQYDREFGPDVTVGNYLRDDGVNTPNVGNLFTQLSKDPVIGLPDSITVPATTTSDATTYYKDEDYWLVKDETVLDGSPRAVDGIEWKTVGIAPTNAFSVTRQMVAGKLDGYYSYVFTYEIDGVETLPLAVPDHADDANVPASSGKNDLVIPLATDAPDSRSGSVIWRKVYRSSGSSSFVNSDNGPFYLLKVFKDNATTAFRDKKRDDALGASQPPKALPPVDAPVEVEYNYNRLIERLDAQVDLVRLIGMDTLVHAAEDAQLKFNLAVVLVQGMNVTDVVADINTNLSAWISRKNFQNNVQIADLVDNVANSPGVDNVRLTRSGTGLFGLGSGSEARNDVQVITATPTSTPIADRDTFTVKIGSVTSAPIYGATGGTSSADTASEVREILEAMPNINEGNTYASILNGGITSSAVTLLVDDNVGFREGGVTTGDPMQEFYIQVDDEVIWVPEVNETTPGFGGTLRLGTSGTNPLKRAQLGSTAASHSDQEDVHILGDISVARAGAGTAGNPFVYQLTFLPNYYSGLNDWGTRNVDLVVVAKGSDESRLTLSVAKKAAGAGAGIQRIAQNDQTIVATYDDDFYLASDELPSYFGVDVIVKAQNTF